jgi:1,4-dihydroxy-2-naphthoyl-CoA hydrolase
VDLWNDTAAFINAQPSGWVKEMGIRIVEATPERVTCEWDVTDKHHQGYGIVHGGVHAGVVETLASIGAALAARPSRVVGLENSTSFIRAVRSGRLHAAAQPITRGRRTQVWETSIWDEHEHLVAVGRLRLLCLEPEGKLG